MISGCSSLTSLIIPTNVTFIGSGAFTHCSNLNNITIPESVVSIDSAAFRYCYSLTSITIPNGVTNLGSSAFSNCNSLSDVHISNSISAIESGTFGGCTSLIHIVIPDSVTYIGDQAFANCDNLSGITIPGNVTSIDDYAFFSCDNLQGVYFRGPPSALGWAVFTYDYNTTIYYVPGIYGWGSTYGDRPTQLWKPSIQTDDGNFGAQGGKFGFSIEGLANEHVKLEACTNLTAGSWEPALITNLTSGAVYFSDPDWTHHLTCFYRLSMP